MLGLCHSRARSHADRRSRARLGLVFRVLWGTETDYQTMREGGNEAYFPGIFSGTLQELEHPDWENVNHHDRGVTPVLAAWAPADDHRQGTNERKM